MSSVESSLAVAIADDHPDQRELLARFVQILGHRVACAVDDGQALLATSSDLAMDLALVDFDMPEVDGLSAAEELSQTRKIPVILISGHPDLNHVVWEKESVDGWLTKPVTLERLRDAIEAVLQRRAAGE